MAAFLNAGVRLGTLRPAIDTVFSLDEIVEAHRHLEHGRHTGKLVITTPAYPADATSPPTDR
jgi:NADPH:quinone reductase-like Zn-dependent oxidoreductase